MDKKKHGPRKGCVYEDMTSTVSAKLATAMPMCSICVGFITKKH